ncbi:MAG: patatin-like phospholipase family protein [Ginsengibacter sp.]
MSYKILSLDGGGSWALIQARVLQDLYGDIRGHALLRQFDMAIANSGGALVLACLCNDMKMSEILDVFEDKEKRKQVFSPLSFWEKLRWRNIASFTSVLGPRYSMERKLKGLCDVLKKADHLFEEKTIAQPIIDTPLNELPAIIKKGNLDLIIMGFDYFRRRSSFFRSNPTSLTDKFSDGKFFQLTLAHAIHSSSNAPVNYFDAPAAIDIHLFNKNDSRKTFYWDGGVAGFNNPVLGGLIEAMTNHPEIALQDYCILSLGTSTGSRTVLTDLKESTDPAMKEIFDKNKDNKLTFTNTSSGFFSDVRKLATSILGDPPDSATFIAYAILDPTLTRNKAKLVRINPCITPEKDINNIYVVPEVYKNRDKEFIALMDLDMDAVEDDEVKLISNFCDKFIVTAKPCISNQLIRGDENSIHLGQSTYQKAKEEWLSCM